MGSKGARSDRPPVALIAGPTASGKSGLAIALAKAHGSAVIINADSAQVYRELSVLSARPQPGDMHGIAHRLYGYLDGAEACSAARWAQDAKAEIADAHAAGALPILVGGTGLYLRTLLDGISPVPPIDPDIRAKVRALPVADAYAALQTEDPERAARLSPNDSSRIARALEVLRSTSMTLGHWQAVKTGGIGQDIALKPLVLLPSRDWLYDRCDRRFAQMLENGAIGEVRALLARDLPTDSPVMRAIGVPEIAAMLNDSMTRADAIDAAQTATRRYAKRQYTWFRNQPPADWPRWNDEINISKAADIVTLFL